MEAFFVILFIWCLVYFFTLGLAVYYNPDRGVSLFGCIVSFIVLPAVWLLVLASNKRYILG